MSAVTTHWPKVGHFDWSEFSDFSAEHKAAAVKMLREAKGHVEKLTLKQAIAEAAREQSITDASVWAAYWYVWLQIRDENPHSERQLFRVIDEWESDQGWIGRASRELLDNAIDCYHTDRIDYACCLFQAWGPNVKTVMMDGIDGGLHARLGQEVAEGTKTLVDAARSAEHQEAGTD